MNPSYSIKYLEENSPLGTAGALHLLKNKMKTSGQKKIEEKEEFYNEKRNEFEQYLKELKANAAKETPPQNSKASEMKTGGFKKNKRKRKRKTKRKRKRKRKTKRKRTTRRKR